MNKESLIDDDDVSLWLYPKERILHHTIKRPVDGKVFRNLLLRGLYEVDQGRANKWLADDREAGLLSADDAAWVREFFRERAMQTNWNYFAILLPKNPRARVNIQRMVSAPEVDDGYLKRDRFGVFEDLQEALNWLSDIGVD